MAIAGTSAAALIGFSGWTFWREDWRYSLPTPRPAALRQPRPGEVVLDRPELAGIARHLRGRPLLLHFYNPDCPCSRFNVQHLQQLERSYRGRIDFLALLP